MSEAVFTPPLAWTWERILLRIVALRTASRRSLRAFSLSCAPSSPAAPDEGIALCCSAASARHGWRPSWRISLASPG